MSDIAKKLRGWCTDWNGAPMVRGEPPRDGLHCDDLLDAASQIERLTAALEPFAEVARWAERNGHDLMKEWDMILRGPQGIAGHLGVQSPEFVNALRAINGQPLIGGE